MRTTILRALPILCLALLPAAAFAQSCQTDVDCASSGNVCNIASCNTTTHTCQTTTLSCNSGDPCEVNSRCVSSVDSSGQQIATCEHDAFLCPPPTNPCNASACTNTNGVPSCQIQALSCPTDNGCMVGSCSIHNGQAVCSYTAVPDGTACNDGNACHQGGTCQAGACSASPIVCGGSAQCNPQTGACSSASTVPPLFTNGDFVGTSGLAPPSPWTVTIGSSGGGFNGPIPQSYSNLNLLTLQAGQSFSSFLIPGTNILHSGFEMLTFVEPAAGGPFSQTDSNVGSGLSWPRYGNQAVIVNQGSAGGNFNTLSQTATVTAANFDPADSKVHIRFAFAPVVGRGAGSTTDPYYFIQVTNVTQGTVLYTDFGTAGNGNQPWQTATNSLDFTPWQLVSVAGSAPAINVGDSIELQIVAACDGDEYGDGALTKVWVDGVGANVPGISVEGSAQANAGTGPDATYTLNYQNQGSQTETNVTVNFTLPPNTTYESLNAPYGAACTNPNVGANGIVSCNVGSLAPGVTGSLSIAVAFPNTAIAALPFRNYGISSDQETTLLGPPISVAGLGVASVVYGPAAGSGSDIVSAQSGAAWSASTNSSWITLTNSSGTGAGLATYTYAANGGATRTGTITFTGSTFQLTLMITQAGASYAQASQLNTVVSTTAGLGQPYGVAVDSSGNLYIADGANNAVEEWNSTNGLTKLFGLTSSANPSNDLSPVGVTLDGLGNVYAAFNSSSLYRSIYEWNPISATAQGLQIPQTNPRAVAVDNAGDLYIANTNEVFEWLPSAGVRYKHLDSAALGVAVDLAGNVYESLDGTGVKELPVSGQSSVLFYPGTDLYGLAADGAGNVYAAAQGANAGIVQWNPVTQQTTTLISSGLTTPQGVAVDSSGNVYIADSGSSTIYELPYAFVPGASVTETAAAGSDQLLPVLPATAPVAAASDSSWLTIGAITNGVVSFSFTQNVGLAARTAHITILGQSIPVTQSGQVPASITASSFSTPQSATVNTLFTNYLTVTVKDGGGNPIAGVNVVFTAPSSGASGIFTNSTNTTMVTTDTTGNALAAFTANTKAGTNYSVTAAVGQLSTSFLLTNTAGPAASITTNAGTTPQTATINTAFAVPLAVTVADSYGNPVSGANVLFQAGSQGPSGVFSNNTITITIATNSSGIASAPFTANSLAGGPSYFVTATLGQLTTSFELANSVGAAASITANTGTTPQTANANTAFSNPLAVTVKDSGSNPVPGVNVTFNAPSTGASGAFSNSTNTITVATTSSGVASAPFTANANGGGPYSVTAKAGQLTTSFLLTNNFLSQTIQNFGTIPTQVVGTPLLLTATATSGLAVGYTSNTQTVCTVNGSSVAFLAPGLCSLTASQAGNSTYSAAQSITQQFTVNPNIPTISNLQAVSVGGNSELITWTTDQPSTSTISGTVTTTPDLNYVTAHSVTLTGLSPNTTYNYSVSSTNSTNGTATSPSSSFTTTPFVGYVAFWGVNNSGITISWSTDFAATTFVAYGTTSALGQLSPVQTALTNGHGVALTGLNPGTTYYFRAESTDGNGHTGASALYTFTTTGQPASPAPVISNVSVSSITTTSATITWTTDQASSTQVNYGTSTSYGSSSPLNSNLINNHSVTLTGLTPGTTYDYDVVSTNSTGTSSGMSTNYTFTTTAIIGTPPMITNIQTAVTSTTATITWTTDQAANSAISGTVTTTPDSNYVMSHSVTLTGLTPGTLYNFAVVSTNAGGLTTTSPTSSFTTTAANATPPYVGYVAFWSVNNSGVTISWSTDVAANTELAFGTSTALGQMTPVQTALTTSHGVVLTGLNSGTTYYFQAQSTGANGATGYSTTYSFTTTGSPSAPAPNISNIQTSVTTTTATITWSTDEAASSQVNYGVTTTYSSSSTLNTALSTTHSVTLTNLMPGTTYNFDVMSANINGTSATSTNSTFQTTGTAPGPVISSVAASSITSGTALITWTTDQASTSVVNYGNQSVSSPTLVTSHSVSLSGLTPNTLYTFSVTSVNAASASTTSSSYTFTTSAQTASAPVVSYVAYWGITSSGITISWSTNVPSNTAVAYGINNSLTSVSPVQTALTNSHGVTLTNLQPATTYSFQAQSADVNGNTGTSTVYTFTTLAGGTPIISNVLVTPSSGNSATISWTTSVPTYSYVQYGPSAGNYIRYSAQTSLTTSPNVSLGFVPSGTIHYQLVSTDANGDQVVSPDATFVEP